MTTRQIIPPDLRGVRMGVYPLPAGGRTMIRTDARGRSVSFRVRGGVYVHPSHRDRAGLAWVTSR